jgi:hypothetical protein
MNNSARKIIKNFIDYTDGYKTLINDWLKEDIIKCYILEQSNMYKCFILISKRDKDPLNEYENSYIFHLIYTFKPYRKNKLAQHLLSFVKNKEQLTVFSYNNCDNLFIKCGFKLIKYNNSIVPTFRYP